MSIWVESDEDKCLSQLTSNGDTAFSSATARGLLLTSTLLIMGCQQSARLTFELQTARQEAEELQKSLKLANDMKEAFQSETEKAKSVVLSLTAENEKMAYELHVRKNSDYQGNSGIFESTKEEFLKMKQWTEMEINRANEILANLLASSSLTEKDEKHGQILRIIEEIRDSEYDPEKLLELGKLRFDFIQELLAEYMDFKSKMAIQLKAMEATITAAVAKSPGIHVKDLLGTLAQAPLVAKLIVVRDIIKRVGLAGSVGAGMDDEMQRLLEARAEELEANASIQEETIAFLRTARTGMTSAETLNAQLKETEQQLAAASEQIAEATAAREQFAKLHEENSNLQSQLKALQEASAEGEDVEKVREMLAAATAANEKLNTESANVQQELSTAKEKLGVFQGKVTNIMEFARQAKSGADPEAFDSLFKALEDFEAVTKEEGVLRQFSFAGE